MPDTLCYIVVYHQSVKLFFVLMFRVSYCTITKQPESGMLCSKLKYPIVILLYSIPDKGCFVFISYCLMVVCHFKLLKIYLKNIYLLVHFIFRSICNTSIIKITPLMQSM